MKNKQHQSTKIMVKSGTKKSAKHKNYLLHNPNDVTTPDKPVTKQPPLSNTSQFSLAKKSNLNVVQIGAKDVERNHAPSPLNEILTRTIITNSFTEDKSKKLCLSEDSAFERLGSGAPRVPKASVEWNNEQFDIPHVSKSSVDPKCSPKITQFPIKNLSRDTSAYKPGEVEFPVDPTEFGRQMGMLDNLYSKDFGNKKRKAVGHDGLNAPSPKQRKMTDHFPKNFTGNREVIGAESADMDGTVAVLRLANLDEDVDESDEDELPDIHSSVDPNDSFRSSNSQDPSDIEAVSCSRHGSVESSGSSAVGHSQVTPSKEPPAARSVNPQQEVLKVKPSSTKSDTEPHETGFSRPLSAKLLHAKVTDDANSSIALSKPARRCRQKPKRFLSPESPCPTTVRILNETLPCLSVNQQRSVDDKNSVEKLCPSGYQNMSQTDLPSGTETVAKVEDVCTAALTATSSLVVQGSLKKKKLACNTAKGKVRKKNTQNKLNNIEIPKKTLMDQWLSKPPKRQNTKIPDRNVASVEGIKGKKNRTKSNAAKKTRPIPASKSVDHDTDVAVREGGNSNLMQEDDRLPPQLPDISKPCESADTESTAPLPLSKPPKKKYDKRKPKNSKDLNSSETSLPSSSNKIKFNKSSASAQIAASESPSSSRSPSKSCSNSSRSGLSSKRLSRTSTQDGGEDNEDLFNYSIDSWGNTVSPKKGGHLTDDETVVVEDNTLDMPQEEGESGVPLLGLLLSSAAPELPTPSHLEPAHMRLVVHAMRREYDSMALLRWLPEQLPWLTNVLRGTEDSEWHQTYLKGPVAMDQLHTFRYYGVLEKSQIRTITDFLAVHLEKELERALCHDPRPTHMYTWRVQVPLVATLMCRAVSGLSWEHSTDLLLSANRGGALDDD